MPIGSAKVGLFGGKAAYDIQLLVVGGGASGGGAYAGGGGAGGLVYISAYEVVNGIEYDVTVGDGGTGVNATGSGVPAGNQGADSVFNVNAEGDGAVITGKGGGAGGGTGGGADGGSGAVSYTHLTLPTNREV